MNKTLNCPAIFDVHSAQDKSSLVGIIALNSCFSLMSVLCNGLVICAILRKRELRTPSYILLTSQALTDLGVGTLSSPILVALAAVELRFGLEAICNIALEIGWTMCLLNLTSGLTLTAIAADRYLAIHCGLSYPSTITHRRVYVIVLCIGVISFTVAPLCLEISLKAYAILVCTCTSICYTTTIAFYFGAFRVLNRRLREVEAVAVNQSGLDTTAYRKGLWTMVLVVLTSTLGLIPTSVCWLYFSFKGDFGNSIDLLFWSTTFLHFSSLANPIIFLTRLGDIRRSCDPDSQMLSGKMSVSEIMLGVVDNEGTILLPGTLPGVTEPQTLSINSFDIRAFRSLVKRSKLIKRPSEAATRIITHQYINWSHSNNNTEIVKSLVKIFTDAAFTAPAIKTARILAKRDVTTFFFRVELKPSVLSGFGSRDDDMRGKTADILSGDAGSPELRNTLVRMIAAFAKTGIRNLLFFGNPKLLFCSNKKFFFLSNPKLLFFSNPKLLFFSNPKLLFFSNPKLFFFSNPKLLFFSIPSASNDSRTPLWPRFSASRSPYMSITPSCEVRHWLLPSRMSLWNKLLPSLEVVSGCTLAKREDVKPTTTAKLERCEKGKLRGRVLKRA
ncbi:predicted protein [Nematostella vectensis]|uniref:G-protein coupled receptors family 1 profile domain-containing protein n=1 Tax=Nematostella vectensis TaxID=45351 RepID=A7SVN0_NEMVE|nr:predicted protein [Nematostella vectensis]|eukprot:XP_001624328.1 predicted protein [Nematostella vectensis]